MAMASASAPAGAADSPLEHVGTVDHPVGGIYISTGTTEAFSTPAIADVTGDGRPDIVVGSLDGTLEAYELPSRRLIWSMSVGRAAIESSPVVVDVTGDGYNDIVVGAMDGRVHLIDGPTGHVIRTFSELEPLHCPPETDCRPHGFFATPAVADINGDGRLDIIAPSWDHTVYAWSATGELLWRRYIEDTLWSSPVADQA
jgi:outer membrane protein assembly factor BamB